jgi:hypothetical protein
MDSLTALHFELVFLSLKRGHQCCYPITDCKETGRQGQRSKTRFLWIRQAGIPVGEESLNWSARQGWERLYFVREVEIVAVG